MTYVKNNIGVFKRRSKAIYNTPINKDSVAPYIPIGAP